jgi:hypothetical protein
VLKKLIYEPLLHFLILGALLFFFYSFLQDKEDAEDSIVISKQRVAQLTSEWGDTFLSLPSEEEKQTLIEKEIYQTVLYKEALKLGLDKSDNDIKGHLAKKMEFVSYDTTALPLPSDEVLEKFMLENAKEYKEEEKIDFTQSMMGVEGDMFEKSYSLTALEASTVFGRSFSEALFNFNVDGKMQTIESEHGIHEVRIIAKSTPELKAFDTVKKELQEDYQSAQRKRKNKAIYEALKAQYDIRVEVQ